MTTATETYDDAIAQLKEDLPTELLMEFGTFDGSETILVPNETTVHDMSRTVEYDQVIQVGGHGGKLLTYPTRVTWDLSCTSTQLRETDAVTYSGRIDWNLVALGHRTCRVFVGDRWYSDAEFIAMIINANSPNKRPVEKITASLRQRGLDLSGSVPMFVQHMVADPDKFNNEVVPFFLRADANDNTAAVKPTTTINGAQAKASTKMSLRVESNTIKVVSMEIGVSDRSKSANGFISFLDASVGTARAIIDAERRQKAYRAVIEDPAADEQDRALAQAGHDAISGYWSSGSAASRRPFRNWGGTSIVLDGDGSARYYSVPVPSGRVTLRNTTTGETKTLSVWKPRGENTPGVGVGQETGTEEINLPQQVVDDLPTRDGEPF